MSSSGYIKTNKFQHHISFQKFGFDVYIYGPRPSVLSNLLCNISVASSLLIFLDPELLYPRADIFFCVFSQKLKRVWDSVTREQKEQQEQRGGGSRRPGAAVVAASYVP